MELVNTAIKAVYERHWGNEQKIVLLLTVAGIEALDVHNAFYADGGRDREERIAEIIKMFEEHCVPGKKVLMSSLQDENTA